MWSGWSRVSTLHWDLTESRPGSELLPHTASAPLQTAINLKSSDVETAASSCFHSFKSRTRCYVSLHRDTDWIRCLCRAVHFQQAADAAASPVRDRLSESEWMLQLRILSLTASAVSDFTEAGPRPGSLCGSGGSDPRGPCVHLGLGCSSVGVRFVYSRHITA